MIGAVIAIVTIIILAVAVVILPLRQAARLGRSDRARRQTERLYESYERGDVLPGGGGSGSADSSLDQDWTPPIA